MANPYLDYLMQTPEYQRLLGFSDAEIQSGIGAGATDTTQRLGGGTAQLGPAVSLAGIASSYKLGSSDLARGMIQDEYQRQANPFNIVTALQGYADSGNVDQLNNPILRNIAPGPASRYQNYIDEQLFGGAGAPTTSMPDAPTQQIIRDAYARYPEGAARFFAGQANPQVQAQPQLGAQPAVAGGQSAQQAGARLLGSSINVGMSSPSLKSRLNAGQVPGLSNVTENDFGRLGGDQQDALTGLLGSTGRVSDPARAIREHWRRYSMGSLGRGSVGY
jgi:hypothetical protein